MTLCATQYTADPPHPGHCTSGFALVRSASICCVLGLMIWTAGCGSRELKSHWRDRDITIDGRNTEWSDYLTPVDDKGTSVALANDQEYLYIGLVTGDGNLQRQIFRGGVTIWFDPAGGEEKKFGIHYPLGPATSGRREGEIGEADRDERQPPEIAQSAASELELIGPQDGEHHRMTIGETGGIDVRFRDYRDTLVFELKVPLVDNGKHPFAIGTKPGSPLGVGLETDAGRSAELRSEEPSEGGRGRGGFGRRGGGFGERPSGSRPGPYKEWAKVELAASAQPAQ